MKPKESLKIFLLVFLSFLAYYLLFLNFRTAIKIELDKITQQGLTSYVLTYLIIGITVFIGTLLNDRRTSIFKSLGLSINIWTGVWKSFLFTLPMFVGGLLFFQFNQTLQIENLIAGTLVAGFMEELYFRGFLFGQLFKKTNLGFIPSIFFDALIFAFGHLHQSQDINELIGIFMITAACAVLFAWLYVEWNFNLWIPIMTHTFMKLWWVLFEYDNTALGGLKASLFRSLTILTAILFTILYKKQKNRNLLVNRKTLLLKKETYI